MPPSIIRFLLGETILAGLIVCFALISHATIIAAVTGIGVASFVYVGGLALWLTGEHLVKGIRR